MTDESMRENVVNYLRRHGWTRSSAGTAGELWTRGADDSLPTPGTFDEVAIPLAFDGDARVFEGLVYRVARAQGVEPDFLREEIEREFSDVQAYRIGDEYVVDNGVFLETAATVISQARRMVRAAATTARKGRPYIGANYSRPGDNLAARARLAHTRPGSFILPIEMPVHPVAVLENVDEASILPVEPKERQVTRTLAAALTAVDRIALRNDRALSSDDLHDLVRSGVSRELVTAVRTIAEDPGVRNFDVRFTWAGSMKKPGRLPERIEIPADATPKLERVEDQLEDVEPEPEQTVSGQIVEIRQLPGEETGRVSVQTFRKSRSAEVHVTVPSALVQEAHMWARDQRAVLVTGSLVRSVGKPPQMPAPTKFVPIDTLFDSRA
jgi:hypothetical protein